MELEKLLSPMINNNICINNDLSLSDMIKRQKLEVINKNISPSNIKLVRPEIVESWIRSAENGLDVMKYNYPPVMDKPFFEQRLKEKEFFLQAADPYISQLDSMLSNIESYIFLSDEEGVILRTVQALWENGFNLVPGSIWSEKTTGTCSHGMCILLRSPIQVCGPEHYCRIFENISCSSAPIFDAEGNLEGTLTIASPYRHSHSAHLLGLVVTMAWTIQKEFQLALKNQLLDATLAGAHDAVIAVDNHSIITMANKIACELLDSEYEDLVGSRLDVFFDPLPAIQAVIDNGSPVFNNNMKVKLGKNYMQISSIQPIKNYDNRNSGCILVLSPIAHHDIKATKGAVTKFAFDKIVGSSPQTIKTINLARKLAQFDNNILLQGESGTGKEVFAQAIHNESRPGGPFIAVNCAAIPRNLIESELFGYEPGAFTGAERQGKPGKIEAANGGTLFLDEIGDMPLEVQAVLLRVIEDKVVVRVGGNRYIPVDFRLVTATNKDLLDLASKNEFRQDLYYRLSIFKIVIPPLRERGSDIIQLAEHFIEKAVQAQGLKKPVLSNGAKYLLLQYNWPGNVRQLENAVIYAACMANDDIIHPDNLPAEITNINPDLDLDNKIDLKQPNQPLTDNYSIKEIERMAIKKALAETNNHIRDAAKMLGLSKSTLYRKIKEYGIEKSTE